MGWTDRGAGADADQVRVADTQQLHVPVAVTLWNACGWHFLFLATAFNPSPFAITPWLHILTSHMNLPLPCADCRLQ